MKAFNTYFFAGFSRARLSLAGRGFLLLLAVDIWANMLESAGRYGIGGFNVAHFELLDAVQPMPTAPVYLATMTLASMGAFVAAVSGLRRWLTAIVLVAFTYGWAMSQLDSYQHHYLISLILVCLLGVRGPAMDQDERDARATDDSTHLAWGGPLLCATIGIVYTFAAISKTEFAWRSGTALQQIVGDRADAFLTSWQAFGGTAETFWSTLGHASVGIQLLIAVAYCTAPLAERIGRLGRAAMWAGFVAAFAFHMGAEWLELKIEWFSYYMLFFALVLLGPRWPVDAFWSAVTAAHARVRALLEKVSTPDAVIVFGIAAAISTLVATVLFDLPGVLAIGAAVGVATMVGCAVVLNRASWRPSFLAMASAGALAAATMLVAVEHFETRFDYYRFVGGDAYRRAKLQTDPAQKRILLNTSIDAYKKANRYAPGDRSRVKQQLRSQKTLDALPEEKR